MAPLVVWHLLSLLLLFAPHAGGDATADTVELRQRLAEVQRLLDNGQGQLESAERRLIQPATAPAWDADLLVGTSVVWVLLCSFLGMSVQVGIAMLKPGSCRVKNVQHVMLMGLIDISLGTLVWWIFGWAFAFSGPYAAMDPKNPKFQNVKGSFAGFGYKDNEFAGSKSFAGHDFLSTDYEGGQTPSTKIIQWFFEWTYAVLAASIVSGGVAERAHVVSYTIYSFLFNLGIYPIIAAWTWGGGWLASMNIPGVVDRAGSGIVHLTGGIGALVGAILCGPREGRFDDMTAKERVTTTPELYMPHSQPLIAFGALTMWFGWYGLTCGSTFAIAYPLSSTLASQIAMNTTLAAAGGGLISCILRTAIKKKNDLPAMCYGLVGGLVAISASCASVECGTAFGIGASAGVIYVMFSALLKVAKVDDPTDAFAVHGGCGMWGLVCASLMDWGQGFAKVHGLMGPQCVGYPNCFDDKSMKMGGNLVAANFAAIFAIMGWSGVLSLIIFAILRVTKKLKYGDTEEKGIDMNKHVPIKGYNFGAPTTAQFGLHSI